MKCIKSLTFLMKLLTGTVKIPEYRNITDGFKSKRTKLAKLKVRFYQTHFQPESLRLTKQYNKTLYFGTW